MNRHNLERMAHHIRTVPQEKFSMDDFRPFTICYYGWDKTECDTVGCVIGHCTILSSEPLPRTDDGIIKFKLFSELFTGLPVHGPAWCWCFSGLWENTDNTPTGAALRIEWLLNNGLPENWKAQMNGEAPLCYLPQTSN